MLLGNILTIKKGKKPTLLQDSPTDYPYLTTHFFRDSSGERYKYVPSEILNKVVLCCENDPIIIWDGSNSGEMFMGVRGVIASTMAKLEVSKGYSSEFIFYLIKSNFNKLNSNTTGSTIPHVSRAALDNISIPDFELNEQIAIAKLLRAVQQAKQAREAELVLERERKAALMAHLFTHGTKGEPLKKTEIGLMPESWEVVTFANETLFRVRTSFVTFNILASDSGDHEVLGVKVSDMNLEGNEIFLKRSNTVFKVSEKIRNKCLPAGSIVFPKRGAAIATNKKRITSTYTTLDPNLIAIQPSNMVDTSYIFHFMETFDLASLQDQNPIPQLNKHNVEKVRLPWPGNDERSVIASLISSQDKVLQILIGEITLFEELFQALLAQLMSGELSVQPILEKMQENAA